MEGELINKVAESGLITLDLESFVPKEERSSLDFTSWLFEGVFLKEKDFRAAVKEHDWQQYSGKHLSVFCSKDAIVPLWAYMLISAAASPFVLSLYQGTPEEMEKQLFEQSLEQLDTSSLKDKRVIIKGCSKVAVPGHAYMVVTQKLRPYVKSLMFGEACSSVPIYKRK